MTPTPPRLTREGRLMLAALGDYTTLDDFVVAIGMRPELPYSREDCLVGLEALTAAGLLTKKESKAGVVWTKTKLAPLAVRASYEQPAGPPSAVTLEPLPGIALTKTEG